MRQINVKFVVILFVLLVVGGGGIFALNRWQVSRNAGSLFTRAEAAIESGDKGRRSSSSPATSACGQTILGLTGFLRSSC